MLCVNLDQVMVIDILAPVGEKERIADFANDLKRGITLEILSLATTVDGDPAGGHFLILRDELPYWRAAAQLHDLYITPTAAPVRLGDWDGDVVVQTESCGHLVIDHLYEERTC